MTSEETVELHYTKLFLTVLQHQTCIDGISLGVGELDWCGCHKLVNLNTGRAQWVQLLLHTQDMHRNACTGLNVRANTSHHTTTCTLQRKQPYQRYDYTG